MRFILLRIIHQDTSGHRLYRSIVLWHPRCADGCLLVFDLTSASSFDSIIEWILELHKNTRQDVPMILIGNKSDLTTRREVTYNQAMVVANQFNILRRNHMFELKLLGSSIDHETYIWEEF